MNLRHSLLYALACVALPLVWGLLMVAVVNVVERAAARRHNAVGDAGDSSDISKVASPEYHI